MCHHIFLIALLMKIFLEKWEAWIQSFVQRKVLYSIVSNRFEVKVSISFVIVFELIKLE